MGNISYDVKYRKRICEKYAKTSETKYDFCIINRISRPTLDRWLSRYDGTKESLIPYSTRPHTNPKQVSNEEVILIKKLWKRWGEYGGDYVYAKLLREHEFKRCRETLYNVLKREGLRESAKKKKKRRANKPYHGAKYPGEKLQMDVKYVPRECHSKRLQDMSEKFYQYTIIDEATGLRYLEWFDELSNFNSVKFLFNAMKSLPFHFHKIQTDNGIEFTYRFKSKTKLSAFEKCLKSLNIRHQLIRPATPRHNGRVERSHRTDDKHFYSKLKFDNQEKLDRMGKKWLKEFNNMPMKKFNYLSPNEVWESYKKSPKKPIEPSKLKLAA